MNGAGGIYVCHRGLIVEQGTSTDVLKRPSHEETARLIALVPTSMHKPVEAIQGAI